MKKVKSEIQCCDNRGLTLVEMIVTFALVSIFMAAAITIISSAVMMHGELTATMYAQSTGEMLLDKITGELAAAQAQKDGSIMIGNTANVGGTEGNGVIFYDRNGVKTLCMVQDGLLLIRYANTVTDTENGDVEMKPGYEWKFDEKSYMGYRISNLDISRMRNENVLRIDLTIKNLKTGFEYSCSRCTKCYNFKTQNQFDRISEKKMLVE